eukprot:1779508-Amphidinium_carterae.2
MARTLEYSSTHPLLQQVQQYLELKHSSQLTKTTPLEFLRKMQLQDDGTSHLSFAQQYYNKILRAYNMDKCNAYNTKQQETTHCNTTA